jgi:tetratricopeptide (TPR) repeat protein
MSTELEELYVKIDQALKKNDSKEIIQFAQEGINKFNFPKFFHLLGMELSEVNITKSIQCFERAIKLQPKDPYILLSLGLAYTKNKKYFKSCAMLQDSFNIAVLDPNTNINLLFLFGQIFLDLEEYELANEAFEVFLKRDGDGLLGHLGLAAVYENLGHIKPKLYEGALICYENALCFQPKSFVANLGKLVCSVHLGDNMRTNLTAQMLNGFKQTVHDIETLSLFSMHFECELREHYLKNFKR